MFGVKGLLKYKEDATLAIYSRAGLRDDIQLTVELVLVYVRRSLTCTDICRQCRRAKFGDASGGL